MKSEQIAFAAGLLALALMAAVLGMQYVGGYIPCEMCHWQRWPLIAAIVVGLIGGLIGGRFVNARTAGLLAALAILLVAISGSIGAYQAGVEWKWWPGPQSCTGARFVMGSTLALQSAGRVVRCDVPAFTLLGISLAGFNALICLGFAGVASAMLLRKGK